VILLECWKDRLVELIKVFQHIFFEHVYRDQNSDVFKNNQGKSSIFRVLRNMRVLYCLLIFFRCWVAFVFSVDYEDLS
jgi:hypothetical protein